MQWCVGIDEVGRGPLAGPVTVCAVQWLDVMPPDEVLGGIRDSKKLVSKKRAVWFQYAETVRGKLLQYAVHSVAADAIDTVGIVEATRTAATEVLQALDMCIAIPHVYADYGLPVPKHYIHTHIVKGDEKNPLIAFASIIAKEERDMIMREIGVAFPAYGFAQHKGYGTKQHREMLQKHGPSPVHRETFLKNILTGR